MKIANLKNAYAVIQFDNDGETPCVNSLTLHPTKGSATTHVKRLFMDYKNYRNGSFHLLKGDGRQDMSDVPYELFIYDEDNNEVITAIMEMCNNGMNNY